MKACPNQAFTIGKHLAMQFHIEIDIAKINSWVKEDDSSWEHARNTYESAQSKEQILENVSHNLQKHQKTADNIYTHWLKTTEWAVK